MSDSKRMPSEDAVKEYYGKILSKTADLKTNACCTSGAPPKHIREALVNVHDEVVSKYYGCGFCIPEEVQGCSILDLGCGAGMDCFIAAQLVGETGHVVGVDMTEEQIAVAKKHNKWHAEKFGFKSPNTSFKKGYIERLGDLDLKDSSFDVIMSNCVINLSCDKAAVFKEAFRVLKTGGELYFSDVYADRRVPEDLRQDPVLWGECLSGALYWNDFINLAKAAGFGDPRLVKDSRITIENKKLEAKCGHINFFSATYRLFKLPSLESHCEDYGQAVIYKGTIARHPHQWSLDGHHAIETGKVFGVCGNTWRMLHDTRFSKHFQFIGSFDKHFGIYDGCGTSLPFSSGNASGGGAAGSSCC